MPGGLPTSALLEVELIPGSGTWVDLTPRVVASSGVTITRGRGDEFGEQQAGVLTATLANHDGAFTPGNPLSPYSPHVAEGRLLRFTATKGAATRRRFFGRVSSWEVRIDDGDLSRSEAVLTAVDVFGQLARRRLACDFTERWLASQRSGDKVDLWPMDDQLANPVTVRNAAGGIAGAVIKPRTSGGSATMSGVPDGMISDGIMTLTARSGVGPILALRTDKPDPATQSEVVIAFRTPAIVTGGDLWIAAGLAAGGAVIWSLRLVGSAGATNLTLHDGTGSVVVTMLPWAAASADSGPDLWYALRMFGSLGSNDGANLHRVEDQALVSSWSLSPPLPVADTRIIVIGGRPDAALSGGQTACPGMEIGPVAVARTNIGHVGYLAVNSIEPSQTRFQDFASYTGSTSTIYGTENRAVTIAHPDGRAGDEMLNELARTIGGAIIPAYGLGSQALQFFDSDFMRPPTPTLTINADADLDASGGFPLRRAAEGRPTRVTATWPAGSVTLVGDESAGRVDGQVDTCAATSIAAQSVAAARLNASTALRMEGVRVDLVTAASDLYAAVMSIQEADRIRVTGLPPALLGRTHVDGYVQAWTETWTHESVIFVWDTSPADDPVEGVWEDAERGRWSADGTMTVTGGTAIGTTGTGTIVVTTAPGAPAWSGDPAQYPLDVDWGGERCTVASVPASTTSPQTLTITARGVAPTVARAHAVGEQVDVWHAAAWTI